jgi:hypothetical protein
LAQRASPYRLSRAEAEGSLRAFTMTLAGTRDAADALIQDTLVRAVQKHDRFEPGAHLLAWLFTTPCNRFSSDYGSRRREVEDVDGLCATTLSTARNSRSVSRSDRHGIVLGPVRPKRAIRSSRWSGTGSRRSLQYTVRSSRPIWSCTCRSRGPEAEVIFVRVATIALHSLQGGSTRLSATSAYHSNASDHPHMRLRGRARQCHSPNLRKSPQAQCVLAKKGPYIRAALAKSALASR